VTAPVSTTTRSYAWRISQGAREQLNIPILDGDLTPVTLTGYTVDAVIKDQPGGEVLYTWPAEDVEIAGTAVLLSIPAPVSAEWIWHVGWYRVKLQAPVVDPDDPPVSRVLQGVIVLDLD
jgi:hypothetical protein